MDLKLQNLSHGYQGLTVLGGINLNIRSGEIVCVVGPSGCGKSTLLRLVGGLEAPDQGQVLQVGAPPKGCLNPLTYVFQDFALLPWRTVAGNVGLVLEDHPLSRDEIADRIDHVLERTGLTEFAGALPKQLSGGMKQRVAIARALAVNPAVMLMDEPLSALDSQTRSILLEELTSLWRRERFTSIYVTHNLTEAVQLGHQIVILSRRPGRIREVIRIDTPPNARSRADTELQRIEQDLWSLMQAEARAADAELADV
ncbi:MAG: ABC transporter ATP-binding protein [Pseudomonadota bacterium]